MKTRAFTLLVFLLFVISAKASEGTERAKLVGTWVLVSIQEGDSPMQVIAKDGPLLYQKQFNETHFCAITYDKKGYAVKTTGGTYQLNGDFCYENLQFSTNKGWANTKSTFRIEIKGNEMHITGTVANGMQKLTEVWKKLE